jgi:hypothetical protein
VRSALLTIPAEKRKQLAATLGLFATLFVAIGVVSLTGRSTPGAVRIFAAVALAMATVLGLSAWGVAHSVKVELAEQRLDNAIEAAVAARPDLSCDCGHEHDPDEMTEGSLRPEHRHDTDACAHDGSGTDCSHSCDTCVLASMRPSPTRSRAERL